MPSLPSTGMPFSPGSEGRPEVVEVSLLLPADHLQALLSLSSRRGESVGQILRELIDDALDQRRLID